VQIQKTVRMLNRVNAHSVLVLCHHNADPDAIGSAYAFSKLLHSLKPDLSIDTAAAHGVSKISERIVNLLHIRLVPNPKIEKADLIFLLDTNNIQQLDEWKLRIEKAHKPLVIIDHHTAHPETTRIADLCIINEKATSTCEIIYSLFREAGVKIGSREALALFLGIAYDTKHFIIASSRTFKAIADLIDSGVKPERALTLLSVPMSFPERTARLKASSRISLTKIGEWLIVSSRVNSFQASAARALLGLGAHVAIVGGAKGGRLQISFRSSRDFYKKTSVHLGRDLAKPLGEYIHGMGGGHSTAAGVNGKGNLEQALAQCLRILREKLEK
jgi:phosphoesterase RecJ-like protein